MTANSAPKNTSKDNPPKRRRSPEDLRREIVRAATEEYSQHGFTGATTAAIARRANTTETQIFRYFASKAELFNEAMVRPLDSHLQEFTNQATLHTDAPIPKPASHAQSALNYIAELQAFIARHEKMFQSLVMAEADKPDGVEGIGGVDALQAYFARGAATMRARTRDSAKIPPELMVRISFASVLGCTLFESWLYPEDMADKAAIREAVQSFILDGLIQGAPNPPSID